MKFMLAHGVSFSLSLIFLWLIGQYFDSKTMASYYLILPFLNLLITLLSFGLSPFYLKAIKLNDKNLIKAINFHLIVVFGLLALLAFMFSEYLSFILFVGSQMCLIFMQARARAESKPLWYALYLITPITLAIMYLAYNGITSTVAGLFYIQSLVLIFAMPFIFKCLKTISVLSISQLSRQYKQGQGTLLANTSPLIEIFITRSILAYVSGPQVLAAIGLFSDYAQKITGVGLLYLKTNIFPKSIKMKSVILRKLVIRIFIICGLLALLASFILVTSKAYILISDVMIAIKVPMVLIIILGGSLAVSKYAILMHSVSVESGPIFMRYQLIGFLIFCSVSLLGFLLDNTVITLLGSPAAICVSLYLYVKQFFYKKGALD